MLSTMEPMSARWLTGGEFAAKTVLYRLHEQVRRELGFRLVEVAPGPLTDRVARVQQIVDRLQR